MLELLWQALSLVTSFSCYFDKEDKGLKTHLKQCQELYCYLAIATLTDLCYIVVVILNLGIYKVSIVFCDAMTVIDFRSSIALIDFQWDIRCSAITFIGFQWYISTWALIDFQWDIRCSAIAFVSFQFYISTRALIDFQWDIRCSAVGDVTPQPQSRQLQKDQTWED